MTFTQIQRKKAYKELPEELQSYITSYEVTEFIDNQVNTSEIIKKENREFADSEIFWAMLGLQSLNTAIENISKLNNRNVNELSGLKSKLDQGVFKKIEEINTNQTAAKADNLLPPPENSLQTTTSTSRVIPDDNKLSTVAQAESRGQETRKNIVSLPNYSNYDSGKDPYREPLE